jgi:S-DNA-T family DNA segregation ATPase FtsK/SpoIIIE
MAKSVKRKKVTPPPRSQSSFFDDIHPHTKQAIAAIFFVVLAIFFLLSSLGLAGIAGDTTHQALTYLFGFAFFLAPVACALFVYVFLKPRDDERVSVSKLIGVSLLFLSLLGFTDLIGLSLDAVDAGGKVGMGVLWPFQKLFGDIVAGVMLFALSLIGIFLTFNTNIIHLFKRDKAEEETEAETLEALEPLIAAAQESLPPEEPGAEKPHEAENEKMPRKTFIDRAKEKVTGDFVVSSFIGTYAPPPLSLLQKDKGRPDVGDVKANAMTIKRTLKKFNIEVEIDQVTPSPSFTQYAIKPAEGIKLEKIVGLQTNIEYALAASPIRIEAPIPGKSLVGIEVPNKQRQMVGLATLFASPEYTDSPKPLLTVLGKDITGQPLFADVARMPHGLIAGTTGSGKSVAIHNIIISLLFRNSPEQLRFIMVDPKLVELTLYNGIPHLLTPVITDPKKVIFALKWAIKEMDRRLEVLRDHKVQNISSYHEKVYRPEKKKFEAKGSPAEDASDVPEPMPYVVIVIDELADLMSAYPKELEACIVRLAQKSRAAGIHLILSTQRPSVNVITGTIKANIPTRAALQVASQIDSRTILDQQGAEKLLGKGDMLFLFPDSNKPKRLQSAFVSEDEVKRVVSYLKEQDAHSLDTINLDPSGDKADPNAIFAASVDDDEEDDDMYQEAVQTAREAGKVSTSFLQRKLRLGYSRAARLIDIMEERGIIGPADGSKPRPYIGDGGTNEEV